MSEFKKIHFRIPKPVFDEFFRVFPGRGERTQFLIKMIHYAIQLGPKSSVVEQVKQICEEDFCDEAD